MKKLCALSASLALSLLTVTTTQAWEKVVFVYCDANTNGMIDSADAPVGGLNIIVTNTSGTFLTSGVTANDGSVALTLPQVPDSYVDFIDSSSLPAGTTLVQPAFGQFTTTSNNFNITNFFLIENANCVGAVSPPMTNDCWLTGGGTIGDSHAKPAFSFGGVVYPGCKATAAGGGNWNVVDHLNQLHFKATSITVVQSGNLPQYPSGSTSPKTPCNFIDFAGTGTLQGIGGNKVDYGQVFFYARALDLGEPGKGVDQFYLQVYDGTGQTLLLISSDPSAPQTPSPVVLRSGNLQLHSSGCGKQVNSNASSNVHGNAHSNGHNGKGANPPNHKH